MQVRIGLENGIEGRSMAWAFDYPGCFSYGKDGSEAVIRFPQALVAYKNWVESHPEGTWLKDLADFDVRLVEVFECYTIEKSFMPELEGIEINAWFREDWKPLTGAEVQRGITLLNWAREELLELVNSLDVDLIDHEFPGERWTIRGILRHIANAEWWYLDRLSLAGIERSQLPDDVFKRLEVTRKRLLEVLPGFVGEKTVIGRSCEFWSPRKILRRSIWHEMDHIQHIQKLAYGHGRD